MRTKIESASNEFFRHLKKLHTPKERTKTSRYLAEGLRAVSDAIKNKADIYAIVLCEGVDFDIDFGSARVYELSKKLFEEVKLTVNSQGILAVINYKLNDASCLDVKSAKSYLYLDSVTDPGNMGTILRSADAFGTDGVILSKGCVDIFNPKVVRSTMASLLNVPVYIDTDPDNTFESLKNAGFDIVGTFPKATIASCDYQYKPKTVLVMGNEANGISDKIKESCTAKITIPMTGNAESLNVATATAVMLYEILVSRIKNKE